MKYQQMKKCSCEFIHAGFYTKALSSHFRLLWVFFLLFMSSAVQAEDEVVLTIADPFIEMHTGPASSYPIFHVLDRGQKIIILKRKTSWYKVRLQPEKTIPETAMDEQAVNEDDVKTGWVSEQQMQQTLLPSGQRLQFDEENQDDFIERKWELGVTTGQLANAPVLSVYGGYLFTENLSAELTLAHSVASVSSSDMIKLNLLMQPFPDWDFSPFVTLGAGSIQVKPNATLIDPADKKNSMSQIGIGLKTYLSRQFILRLEYNQYVIFSANNDKDENEDLSEWKIGFAIFF